VYPFKGICTDFPDNPHEVDDGIATRHPLLQDFGIEKIPINGFHVCSRKFTELVHGSGRSYERLNRGIRIRLEKPLDQGPSDESGSPCQKYLHLKAIIHRPIYGRPAGRKRAN